jgi:hypothetical protein
MPLGYALRFPSIPIQHGVNPSLAQVLQSTPGPMKRYGNAHSGPFSPGSTFHDLCYVKLKNYINFRSKRLLVQRRTPSVNPVAGNLQPVFTSAWACPNQINRCYAWSAQSRVRFPHTMALTGHQSVAVVKGYYRRGAPASNLAPNLLE